MKTNRYILSLLLLMVSAFNLMPANAQQNQYAIYNYRNDGDFNAWLNIDVDSITYSCIDMLGVEHDDVVVQEVWTPDSVYRIPISAIDSLGFHAPEPVYKEKLFHIRKYHLPYIIKTEGLTISFSRGIEKDSLPNIGQIMISDVVEEPLPRGFSGRVLSIEVTPDSYLITCEAVALTDIFERLVLVGRSESYTPEEMQQVRRARRASPDDTDWDGIIPFEVGKFSLNIPSIEGFVSNSKSDMTLGTISITPKFCVSYILDIRPFVHSHVKVLFENKSKVSTEMHLKVSGESSLTETKKTRLYLTKVPIPLVTGVLYGEVAVSGDLWLKGNIDLKATFSKNLYSGDEYEWSTSDFWKINHERYDKDPKKKNKGDDDIDENEWQSDVTLSVNGSFGFGASLDLVLFAVSENTLEISNTTTVGPELSGSLQISSEGLKDGTLYSTLKNTNVTFTSMKLSDEVKFNICMREFTLGSFSKDFGKNEFKLFPDFEPLSIPKYPTQADNTILPLGLYTIVKNDVLPIIPLKLGIGRYDPNGNLVDERFASDFYQYEDEWDNKKLCYDMSSLTTGSYTFHPLIRIWGLKALQLKAMPQTVINIPPPMSLSSSSLKLAKGSIGEITIIDGWGDYEVESLNNSVASATIVTNNLPDGSVRKEIQIKGKAVGNTKIRVKDKRSEEEAIINVTVTEEEVINLTLSETSVSLQKGDRATVTITSGSGNYTLENSDAEVIAAAIANTNQIVIAGQKAGTATITVTDTKTLQTAEITVTVTDPAPTDIPAEAIDLGLPSGTLWASYNVGATKPEEYGSYFAWGETQEKKSYYFTNYSLCDGTVSSCHNIGDDISGTEYDVAHVRWGSEWYMPSKDDFYELTRQCEQKETTVNGVKGYQFTGPNGKSIFLPYAGYFWNTENSKAGTNGSYWSSTLTTSVNHSQEMSFSKGEVLWDCYINRFAGLSVRPVKKGNSTTPDLSLESTSPVNLEMNQSSSINIVSGSGSYTAISSAPDVATAEVNNATVVITAHKAGSATITVTDTKTKQTATIAVTVTDGTDVSPGEAIDLGLPSGTLWASCNVGATKPEEYGDYFAWGETKGYNSGKTTFKWNTYFDSSFKKYNINGGLTELALEDDAAYVNWGSSWRMPSKEQQDELRSQCTWTWTQLNGVYGCKVTGPNGKSIFLPAAGWRTGTSLYHAGSRGYCWSRSLDADYSSFAYFLYFGSGYVYLGYDSSSRCDGQSVRPVRRK